MNEDEKKEKMNEIDFSKFTPEQVGEAQAELTDLINQIQDLLDKCETVLKGGEKE